MWQANVLMNLVMMSVARNVAEGCSSLKAGRWERSQFTGIELKGKTLGIVGAVKGKIWEKMIRIHTNLA